MTQPEVALVTSATGTSDLLSLHESIAGLLATQGDYRRAYQHLRAALDLSRAGSLRDSLTAGYNRRYLDQRLEMIGGSTPSYCQISLYCRSAQVTIVGGTPGRLGGGIPACARPIGT